MEALNFFLASTYDPENFEIISGTIVLPSMDQVVKVALRSIDEVGRTFSASISEGCEHYNFEGSL